MGETAHWWVGLIPNPLVGGALSLGEIRGSCVPGESLSSLFTNGWGCDPTWIIVWPGVLRANRWGQTFPKWQPPEEHTVMNIPRSFACNVLPPQQATVTPFFSQEFLQELQSGPAQIPMESLLCPGTQHTQKPVCAFQEWVSLSPSPMELPHTSPLGLQCQMHWGLFLPMLGPQAWGPDVGLRTLTPVGDSL